MTANNKVSESASEALLAPDTPVPPAVPGSATQDYLHGLKPTWPVAADLLGSNLPCRLEGEIADLVVYGEVPKEINGTFFRVMCDPFVPPHPNNVPLDGDGNISAFRIHDGRVDMKMRYIETERYKLERSANKALFGLYRNPYTHHPCVRAAVDSTANTNLVYWANQLLALKEGALPYAVDPHTLATRTYDPFGPQIKSKTFTAHPKVDPFTNELVVFGYEAKGLATRDVATYTLDNNGQKVEEQWLEAPWCALIHDCVITENWLVLLLWPFESNMARLQAKKQHWAWNYDLKATFIVVPRRKSTVLPAGWKLGESRYYEWKNCMPIHTAGGWEGSDGKIYLESSRVHDNAFPFFPPDDGRMPSPETKADFVRWELDLNAPTGSSVPDPEIILDLPCEFPRIDERFMTKEYSIVFLDVFLPENSDGSKNIFHGLNALAMHNNKTGNTRYFYSGADSMIQEPIFIPRSSQAPEGDGWVIAMIERRMENRCDLVVIDTKEFEKPIAIVQLPFHLKAQIHGNWVDAVELKGQDDFVKQYRETKVSGRGALEPMI
ncbi:lignostilbene-alpha,beta-dioxygenase-like protein [Bisporella sp. PMI_857]|nr:lignostilbene-alpha,beta-dioxygenase-like protein [Bisporella sp. PMI_857]